MRVLLVFFTFLSLLFSQAQSSGEGRRRQSPESGSPWLGVHLTWMRQATAAQLNDVPSGFGLLIDSIEINSPAEKAGLQSLDVLWKFDDQLVASKRQLFALIKHSGVGKTVNLTISRAGESQVLPLVIEGRPENFEGLMQGATEVLMPPLPGVTVIERNLGKRSGFIEEGGVTVSLSRQLDGFVYSVSTSEKVIDEGRLEGEDVASWPKGLDEKTCRKLEALTQSIINAENRSASTPRRPRVRRVPVKKEDK